MKNDEVGYRKPPAKYQFKKGQSGNPNGRPKRKDRGMGDIVAEVMSSSATYTEGDQRKVASRDEIGLRALIKQAVAGKLSAAAQIYKLIKNTDQSGNGGVLRIRVIGGLPDH